jgi:hypothetical protein
MKTIKVYINYLQTNGKYFFSKREVLSKLKLNDNQFYLQISRLYKKKLYETLDMVFL